MERGAEAGRVRTRLRALLAAQRGASEHCPDPRWAPSRRAVTGLLVAAFAAAVIAGWWVARSQPRSVGAEAVSASASAAPGNAASASVGPPSAGGRSVAARPSAAQSSTAADQIVVDVVGRVRHPGVYRLGLGSRVDDAVRAAGGAVGGVDLTVLNLARKLSDGEQLAVGVSGAPQPGAGAEVSGQAAAGASGSADGLVDLNTATLAQLDGLPGVGPVLAQHIIDWRTAHGRFDNVQQLNSVSGIGDAKYSDLKSLVTVT